MCNMHHLRWRRHGDPTIVLKEHKACRCGQRLCRPANKLYQHLAYVRDRLGRVAKAKRWAAEHPHARKQIERRWAAANPENVKARHDRYLAANMHKKLSWNAARRAARSLAAPKWLTADDWRQIEEFYRQAKALTAASGVPHDVDHIVPLTNKFVAGLHVPWNLQILPSSENGRKSNKA